MKNSVLKENVHTARAISFAGGRHTSFFKPFIQPKLTINQPTDIYEQEADAIAEKIIRMPGTESVPSFFSPKPTPATFVQRACASCEEEEKLQRKEDDEQPPFQLKAAKEFDVQRRCD